MDTVQPCPLTAITLEPCLSLTLKHAVSVTLSTWSMGGCSPMANGSNKSLYHKKQLTIPNSRKTPLPFVTGPALSQLNARIANQTAQEDQSLNRRSSRVWDGVGLWCFFEVRRPLMQRHDLTEIHMCRSSHFMELHDPLEG